MRTFGTMELEKDYSDRWQWKITAEPHVMIILKAVFKKVDARQIGTVWLHNSPEVCRDLEWFCDRYPLAVKQADALKAGADSYRKTTEELERMRQPDYAPRSYSLALPPRHYQSLAADLYLARRSQLLADHVGLGKSITALAAMTDKRTLPALVVCQAHLPRQWKDYAGRFLPLAQCHIVRSGKPYQLPAADIYIITYHKLSKWAEVLKDVAKSVVFDEVQELRHDGSKKYCAAAAIRERCGYAMGLSATPIYNYGGEIHNVLQVLCPDEVGTRQEFDREWCEGRFGQMALKDPEAFGAYLREKNIMVRRTRTEVGMELPPVQTIVETVEHNDKVLLDLDTCATELARRILAAETDFHGKGEAAREFDMKLRQATGIAKAPFVAAFVKMLLDDGEKVVLTGWHRAVYDIWGLILRPHNEVFYYTGTESPAQKAASVERFILSKKPCVFVMSLRSGSGLDGLQTACHTIVHGELDWSPGIHLQCTGRVARDGQDRSVFEFYMVSDGGSDPVVADVLGLKKAQSDALLNPNTSGLATSVQADDVGRVKRLAQAYLERRRTA